MKKLTFIFYAIAIVVVLQSCNSKDRSKEIAQYESVETKLQLNETLQKKVGNWIKEGADCYGIITVCDSEGIIYAAKEVKARVLIIENDKIKMKALENINLAPKAGCTKMGIANGDTWWEEEGDLFQTREEALEFIKNIKVDKKSPAGTKFTVN